MAFLVWGPKGQFLTAVALAFSIFFGSALLVGIGRTHRGRTARRNEKDAERLERMLLQTQAELKGARDRLSQAEMRRAELERIRENADARARAAEAGLHRFASYGRTLNELIGALAEQRDGVELGNIQPYILLTGRAALCLERGLETDLAIVREGPAGHRIVHASGHARVNRLKTALPLAEVASGLGDSYAIVNVVSNGQPLRLVALATGQLADPDRDFLYQLGGLYAIAGQLLTSGSPLTRLGRKLKG